MNEAGDLCHRHVAAALNGQKKPTHKKTIHDGANGRELKFWPGVFVQINSALGATQWVAENASDGKPSVDVLQLFSASRTGRSWRPRVARKPAGDWTGSSRPQSGVRHPTVKPLWFMAWAFVRDSFRPVPRLSSGSRRMAESGARACRRNES